MKKTNLIISIICSICFIFSMVAFAIVTIKPNGSKNNGGDISHVSDDVDPQAYQNVGDTKGSDFDPYYIYDANSFIELVSKYGGSLISKYEPAEQISLSKVIVSQKDDSDLDSDFYDIQRKEISKEGKFALFTEDGNAVFVKELVKTNVDENNLPEHIFDKDGKELEHSKELLMMDEKGYYAYVYSYVQAEITEDNKVPSKLFYADETEVPELVNLVLVCEGNLVYKPVMAEGKVVTEVVKDENGNVKYQKVSDEKTEKPHFEIVADIDFSEVDYVPLFESKNNFVGVIDGKDHKLSNVSINLDADNMEKYFYSIDDKLVSHIGMFANANACEIKNLTVDTISISVDDEVYNLIGKEKYVNSQEILIGSLIANDNGSKISNVNVKSSIDAEGFGLVAGNKMIGKNAVSGLIGFADGTTVDLTKVDVNFVSDGTVRSFYFGGAMGYAWNSTISNSEVVANVNANAKADKSTYIAGVAGQMTSTKLDNIKVELTVSQLEEERFNSNGVNQLNINSFNIVAGVCVNVNDANKTVKSEVSKIRVDANVDMDAIYGGMFYEVKNDDAAKINVGRYEINSTVNVLKAYGFAAKLNNVQLDFDLSNENDYFNVISLIGNVSISKNSVYSFIESSSTSLYDGHFENIKLTISKELCAKADHGDQMKIDNYFLEANKI